MKLVEWHEFEQQNFKNDWSYFEKSKIPISAAFKDFYATRKANHDALAEPYLYKYKCRALD